tara:strand:+ start:1148 stop:1627 length:480 start_codon:yes stop_codon:yes gene_type:complete
MDSYQKFIFIIVLATVSIIINIYALNKKDNEFNGRIISSDQVMTDLESFFGKDNTVDSGVSDLINFFKNPDTMRKLGFVTYATPYILYASQEEDTDCSNINQYVTFACTGKNKTCSTDVALYDGDGANDIITYINPTHSLEDSFSTTQAPLNFTLTPAI